MLRLFHVSEEPDIKLFEPRPPPSPDAGVSGHVVWAIDEVHLPNYLLPRDCSRVTFSVGENTTPADIERFFDNTDARRMIVVEKDWLARITETALYVYEMPAATFRLADSHAGYYLSRERVKPLSARRVRDPFSEIFDRGCEIRLVPDLYSVRDEIVNSSLSYSIIRTRNAEQTKSER